MSGPLTRDLLNQMLRSDFRFFVWRAFHELNPEIELRWNWHLDALCQAVETMAATPGDRLAIAVGPRHLKSIIVSIAFVAWMLGRNPALKFLVASYGGELSGELADQFIKVIEAPWYRAAFPQFKVSRKSDGEIKTTRGGGRKPVSVGGATTGFGADYIIVDDLIKAQAADQPGTRQAGIDYFRSGLVTRLNNAETGRIAVVGQRLHDEDVIGYCLETGIYRYLCLPAIAPGPAEFPLGRGRVHRVKTGDLLFYPMHVLDQRRLEMGERAYRAQLLQDTAGTESLFIKWHRIHRYAEQPPREAFAVVVQSWDTAQAENAGADFSVCTTWGFLDGKWWLLHLLRFQKDFAEVKAQVLAMRAAWRADHVVIEDVASGSALLNLLRFERR
ncbi:MAG TPA: hypothetical protein VMQ73_06130, partial [Methylomirabilota bacterium]|nr:hypothetical protein [Methylomirabilota bacterium]